MSTRYLLTCDCGKTIEVATTQAGGRATCACGKETDVPPYSQLASLPIAPSSEVIDQGRKVAQPWGLAQGVIALGIIAAILLAIPGMYLRMNMPESPNYTVNAQLIQQANRYKDASPADMWTHWKTHLSWLAENGFQHVQTPDWIAYEKQRASIHSYSVLFFSLSAAAIAFAFLFAIFWIFSRSKN